MEDTQARERRLEGWVHAYGTSVLRMCFVTLADAGLAEDAMQETFLKAWRSMDGFQRRNGASEKTWLMRIALNVCRDMGRTRWARHIDRTRTPEDLPLAAAVPPEDRSLLMDVMRLPEKYKRPLLLYYYQDMTLEETAQVLGVSRSTVYGRLKRAEAELRVTLTDHEADTPGKGGGRDA